MWDVWIDTGGTFTDAVARSAAGEVRRAKVLSSSSFRLAIEAPAPDAATRVPHLRLAPNSAPLPEGLLRGLAVGVPGQPEQAFVVRHAGREVTLSAPVTVHSLIECRASFEAPILAAHVLLGVACDQPLPPMRLRLATTRGTNALLEGRLAPVALFITDGFVDLPAIGDQTRPDLFALDIRRPAPLHRVAFGVAHRLSASGDQTCPLDERRLRADAQAAREAGCTHGAVALLHGWRAPAAERRVAEVLKEEGFEHVSCSAELMPAIGLLARAETAVVNAALAPEIDTFVSRVRGALAPGSTLRVMTSAGALALPDALAPKDTLLSGPAGGYVGAIDAAHRAGHRRVLTFDMGGTSTDVARSEGTRHLVSRHRVGASSILAPAVAVESIAAGGGSICTVRAGGLRVGPESAGATPGPACYGAGGPLTLTDVNLLLGYLDPGRFPLPLRPADAERAALDVLARARADVEPGLTLGAMLRALRDLADDAVAAALGAISTRQGCDPAEYALVAFGGAGGQHACAIAERLNMREVIIPPDQGLLSARGVGATSLERIRRVQVLRRLEQDDHWLEAELDAAVRAAKSDLAGDLSHAGEPAGEVACEAIVFVRAPGQESTLPVDVSPTGSRGAGAIIDAFEGAYARTFAHPPALGEGAGRAVEVESIRVRAVASPTGEVAPGLGAQARPATAPANPASRRGAGTPVLARADLAGEVSGPVLIHEAHSVTLVEAGWRAAPLACGALRLSRAAAGAMERQTDVELPLDVLAARLGAIATDMGELLRRTAISVNIRERVDFSCAVLDSEGELIVNAPHVPVHLGALGVCVREVARVRPMAPGDIVITNHPAFGGSHLPDVTLVAPAHHEGTLVGYVAARAHHAEIGGIAPGSMSAGARSLAEEAVVIPPMDLVRQGVDAMEDLEGLLSSGPWPSRAPRDNLADVRAALAACVRGRDALCDLAGRVSPGALARDVERLKARADARLHLALQRRGPFRTNIRERLDAGPEFRLCVESDGECIAFDFSGTDPAHASTLNATPAIVRSVIIYALRVLLDEDAALNEGLMRRTRVTLPECFLNPAFAAEASGCPAVGAGNVETSQRVANAIVRALGLAAESQGTMNNVLMGGEGWSTYETLGGGAGAGPGFSGASCVHTHMTNTRLTDPDVLEARFPIRIERFARRWGSGGAGQCSGGDGLVREYAFEAPACVTLLSQRRDCGPPGLMTGLAGRAGRQWLLTRAGEAHMLGARTTLHVSAGDRLIVETPGGGGWIAMSE